MHNHSLSLNSTVPTLPFTSYDHLQGSLERLREMLYSCTYYFRSRQGETPWLPNTLCSLEYLLKALKEASSNQYFPAQRRLELQDLIAQGELVVDLGQKCMGLATQNSGFVPDHVADRLAFRAKGVRFAFDKYMEALEKAPK